MIITAATANVYLNPFANIDDSKASESTVLPPKPPTRSSHQQHRRRKSSGVSLHGGGMTMSIIELMHHIVREPAPKLPEGRFEKEAEEFVDACLEKEIELRKTPGLLLVSFQCSLFFVFDDYHRGWRCDVIFSFLPLPWRLDQKLTPSHL
jgi:mitogen-activated protein kinase kinase